MSEHANGALRGQLLGTVIHHATCAPCTAISLAVAVIEATFLARTVTPTGCT